MSDLYSREGQGRSGLLRLDEVFDSYQENISRHAYQNGHRQQHDGQHLKQLFPFAGVGNGVTFSKASNSLIVFI